MDKEAVLEIKTTHGNVKSVAFFTNFIEVEHLNNKTAAKYTDVVKIKYNSKSIKITFKDGQKIKIPCTSSDIKKVKTIFCLKTERITREVQGSALVTLGDLKCIVLIRSNGFREFKESVFQKIAKIFYPVCESSMVNLEMLKVVDFYLTIDKESEVLLRDDDDFDAALVFFDNRLKITLKIN